jgi:hypothetical protein
VRNACHRLVMRGIDRYRHKLFVHGDIEKFFSIRTPARLCAAMIGYLDSPAWAGKRPTYTSGSPEPDAPLEVLKALVGT